MALPPPTGRLLVDNLTYFHPGADAPALHGISFELDAGDARDESRLDGYDLTVLDDRPADQVPEAMQRALVEAVRYQRDAACSGREQALLLCRERVAHPSSP